MSFSALAAQSATIIVTGKVLSFDKNQVVLLVQNKKYSVPRESVLHGNSLTPGNIVRAEIKNPFGK
jgi:hypothetical protein